MWKRKFYGIVATFYTGSSGLLYSHGLSFFRSNSVPSPSPDDLTLQSVQVFFRHGARTPLRHVAYLQEIEWPKDKLLSNPPGPSVTYKLVGMDGREVNYSKHDEKFRRTTFKGGAHAGHMTKLGKQQMYNLGKQLRREYINSKRLEIDRVFDDTEVFVRSTNMLRTVESAQWLINGMFDVEKRIHDEPIVIYTDTDEDEILYPNVNFCIRLKNINKRFYKHVDDIPGLEKSRLKHASILKYGNGENGNKKLDYQELRDELSARLAHDLHIPKEVLGMMDDINKHAIEMLRLMVTGPDPSKHQYVLSLSCGPVIHMALQNMQATAKGHSIFKLHLFSAHDSLLMALLLALGIFDGQWPPYAADIRLELYEDKKHGFWVRVLYLGKPQKLAGKGGKEYVTLEEFRNFMAPYALSLEEYRKLCGTKADEEEGGEVMDVIGGSKK